MGRKLLNDARGLKKICTAEIFMDMNPFFFVFENSINVTR